MGRNILGGMLVGLLLYGCPPAHNRELKARLVYDTPQFPEPQTKTQEIAAYLREHGQAGERGALCGMFKTDLGSLTVCYIDLNKPFDYSDDVLYFGFETFDHTCIDWGVDDTLDDVVLDGTTIPVPVTDIKPAFQKFVLHEYAIVLRKVYREMKQERLL